MAILNPTPDNLLLDREGRPYFLWDLDMTLEGFLGALRSPDVDVRAYFAGKLLRQAKPDDVFRFLSLAEIGQLWPSLERYLGRTRPFWSWLLGRWGVIPGGEA